MIRDIDMTEERGRILVIDDELGPRESLRFLLMDTCEVTCVDSVDEGLKVLLQQAPDLIIMDIRMPGKSGIQGLKEIRQQDSLVSVVMLTGFGALETAQEALRLGANDYLKKPFDTKEMRQIVYENVARTRHERKRVRASRELNVLNARLAEELVEKEHLANVGQASAEFAHDLRNPLSLVTGYIQLLDDQLSTARAEMGDQYDEVIDYLALIERNLQRCHDLASTWQQYCKNGTQRTERMRLHPLLEELVEGIRPLADSCGVTVEFISTAGQVEVDIVASQILRALHNIITNALQAVCQQSPGQIQIRLSCGDHVVRIDVSDNGPGMNEEQVEKALDAYFTTKPEGQGTGLGLHIAGKIMQEHHGSVHIAGRPGQGACVALHLPEARSPLPATPSETS